MSDISSPIIWPLTEVTIRSLVKFLSIGALNSLVSLRFGVVFSICLQILITHSTESGAQGGGLVHKWLIPLPSTALVPLVTGVELSTPFLLILQEVRFAPAYYTVVIVVTSYIVGNFCACGACTTPVLIVKSGWLVITIHGALGESNTGISSCLIPIIRLFNKFWWFFPDRSSANWTCASLAFALFKPFTTLFIVIFVTQPIRLFPVSSIVVFLLCGSDRFWCRLLSNFRHRWLDYHSCFSLEFQWTYQQWRYLPHLWISLP